MKPKANVLRCACVCALMCNLQVKAFAENPGEIFLDPGAGALSGKASSAGVQGAQGDPVVNWEMLMVLEKTRLGNIRTNQGQAPFSQVNYLDPIVQHALEVRLTPNLGVYALSQAKSFSSGDKNRVFDGVDAQLLNLFLAWKNRDEDRIFFAGKFDFAFGEAWHRLDGIYSGFSGDYHYEGALGLGARQSWQGSWGKTALTQIVFKRDHSVARDTWFSRHEELKEQSDQNGLADTPGLRSGGVSWEMAEIPGMERLRLSVDVGRVAQGYQGRRAMNAVAGTIEYRTSLADDTDVRIYGEVVNARGFDGRDVLAEDAILSVSLTSGRFIWTATSARRRFSASSGELASQGMTPRDRGASLALTYASEAGPILQAGVLRQHAQGIAVTQITVRAIYQWAPR